MLNRIGQCEKLKMLRRGLSLLLVCLIALSALPKLQTAQAADDGGFTTTTVYEWRLITSQADIPEAGTYPMILCYSDFDGNQYYLKGKKLNEDGDHCLKRDGGSSGAGLLPPVTEKRYQYWLNNDPVGQSYAPQLKSLSGISLQDLKIHFASIDAFLQSDSADPADTYLYRRWSYGRSKSDYDTNYVNATALDANEKQRTGINMTEDSFITETIPTDWQLKVCSGSYSDRAHDISILCQGYYLTDVTDDLFEGFQAEIGWSGSDSSDAKYRLYTPDLGGNRAYYTAPGYCQIYWYDKGGYDTGICWDGHRFGGIEDNDDCFSMFRLYYGVEKTLSTISSNYTLPAGAFLAADDNLKICEGVTLTIAPGAIMSVTGNLILNGVINNCGTMVLNPGSSVTTLQAVYPDCGQINCYGGTNVEVEILDWLSMDKEKLAMLQNAFARDSVEIMRQIESLRINIGMNEDGMQYYESQGISFDKDKILADNEKYQNQIAELEEMLALFESTDEKDILSLARKYCDVTSGEFMDCQGELIILEDALLSLCTMENSTINLYPGSVCVNAGTMVIPRGIRIDDAEFKTLEGSHTFIGYQYPVVSRSGGVKIYNPGTRDAEIDGMTIVEDHGNLKLYQNFHFASEGVLKMQADLTTDQQHISIIRRYDTKVYYELESDAFSYAADRSVFTLYEPMLAKFFSYP